MYYGYNSPISPTDESGDPISSTTTASKPITPAIDIMVEALDSFNFWSNFQVMQYHSGLTHTDYVACPLGSAALCIQWTSAQPSECTLYYLGLEADSRIQHEVNVVLEASQFKECLTDIWVIDPARVDRMWEYRRDSTLDKQFRNAGLDIFKTFPHCSYWRNARASSDTN
ncbi:hypothetical protein H4R33_005440 [Dimargaris cristalligena]|uniref:Uncharacterized protein n=1 Tax=Dimargaris cristalligena TaxID=215637 RepID=A0A4V1J4X0_9FUNG|nr:hypothetical protein H4R33_005440 [Dimargaris cristalligena]RKP37029.1 hypothetical protein BJ085DRAFT_37299 [Dimargaris cristalligena]|eukprot:RKP37029.1 hypothetical protein BJ085DRAFT_37299 [Dimargaris cristalligena]